nr:MAG TPA: hypothetical protein [Caudoviricetes sp.]
MQKRLFYFIRAVQMLRMGKNYVPTRARKRRKRAGLYFRQINGTISKMEIVEN